MTKEAPRDRKNDLINRILDTELKWFLTVNPTLTSECQQHPEAFKLMRSSAFETWSEETLVLYLEHLIDAQSKGRNLVIETYDRIAKKLGHSSLEEWHQKRAARGNQGKLGSL